MLPDKSDVSIEKRKDHIPSPEPTSTINRLPLLNDFSPAVAAAPAAKDQNHAAKDRALPKEIVFDNVFEKIGGLIARTPATASEGATNAADSSRTSSSSDTASSIHDKINNDLMTPGSVNDLSDVAHELVSATRFPQHMKSLFQDAAARFSQENPGERGSSFARMMTSALRAIPGDHGLRVDYAGSEGMRDGNTDVLLMKADSNENDNLIGEASIQYSNGATPQERAAIAQKLQEGLADYMPELGNKKNLDQIVKTANDLVVANGLGKDLNPIFEQAVSDFSRKNPNTPGDTFTRLLNGAIQLNPEPASNLSVGFASGGGPTPGFGIAYLSDSLQDKGRQVLAEVPMLYQR